MSPQHAGFGGDSMARQRASKSGTTSFLHPQAGRSEQAPTRLAVRWHDGVSEEAKDELLEPLGLTRERAETEGRQPLLEVNETTGLSWVRATEGDAIPDDTERALERSEHVEWVGRAFRGEKAEDSEAALFTVNPTRLYVTQSALDAVGGLESEALRDVALD